MYKNRLLIGIVLLAGMSVANAGDCHYQKLAGEPPVDSKAPIAKIVASKAHDSEQQRRRRELMLELSKPVIDPWTGQELTFEFPHVKGGTPSPSPASSQSSSPLPQQATPAKKSGSF